MTPDDARTPPCGVDEEQLIAYLDGELEGAPREEIAAHLTTCEACAATADEVALAGEALGALPALRCPDYVATAAEEASRVSPARQPRRASALALATAALAASLAAVAFWPTDPRPRLTESERQALAALQGDVGGKAAAAGIQALDRGLVRPTRRVIATVSDNPLGRWSARAADLFQSPAPPAADPTEPALTTTES